MRSVQLFSVALPTEIADAVKAKVASGEYASESDVICDGLRALLARDRAVENWLREQVAPAYDALKADPSRAVSVDDCGLRWLLSGKQRNGAQNLAGRPAAILEAKQCIMQTSRAWLTHSSDRKKSSKPVVSLYGMGL